MVVLVILVSAYLISRRRALPVLVGVALLGVGIVGYTIYHVVGGVV